MRSQYFRRNTHLRGIESSRGDPAALAIAAIVHLLTRRHNVPTWNGHIRRETQDAAAALRRVRRTRERFGPYAMARQ